MKITRRVRPYESISPLFGLCWVDYPRNEAVTAPIPLNVPIALAHAFCLWMQNPLGRKERLDKIKALEYGRGYSDGRRDESHGIERPE